MSADTPLLVAVSGHQHASVKELLAHGADVKQANAAGVTPLSRCLGGVSRATAAIDSVIMK